MVVGNVVFHFNFFLTKIQPNPLPNFTTYPISIPLPKTSMVDATNISTHVVVVPTSNDWIMSILAGCFQVSTIVASNMINEVVLILI